MSRKLDETRREINRRTGRYDRNELETRLLKNQRASRNKNLNTYIKGVMLGEIKSEIPGMREFIENMIKRGAC